jgi:membrane-associated protein
MELIELLLHFDEHLATFIANYGTWVYVLLFGIIFAETGFVVTPFLPGDSLLFVVGSLAGSGYLNYWVIYFVLIAAAILGDTVNYWIGHHTGHRVFKKENSKLFNRQHLETTRKFFEKHGGKTIILARFLPIVRTFAPFVAGMGSMHYRTFLLYNIVGAFVWVTSLTAAGYFLGALPIIKDNFEKAIFVIIFLSLLPPIFEYVKARNEPKVAKEETTTYAEIEETFKKEKLK